MFNVYLKGHFLKTTLFLKKMIEIVLNEGALGWKIIFIQEGARWKQLFFKRWGMNCFF